jgi:3-phenylpropionate/trans-cinnamate dioxygenase ferredoxin reductase subunit
VDKPRTVLVVGGGPAGTLAAIEARKQDPAATVALLSDEGCEPYEKPPLSKGVLLGTVRAADAPIAGPGGLAAHGVRLECGARVREIDRGARVVALADGRRLEYDALILATGSLVRELPLLPLGRAGVHYLRTEADALRLLETLRSSRRLLVVGAGLIGLEVAASAVGIGVHVTVVELAPRILSRVCDEHIGAIVEAAHRDRGVDLRLATGIAAVAPATDGPVAIETTHGDRIEADLVVVGTGAHPNDALARAAGLAVDDGIVVDERCRTSDPRIFAAGDAVRFPAPHGPVRLENWRHAQEQGAVAGRNASGASDAYRTIPSFWSEQYDLYIQGVGWMLAGGQVVRRPLPGNAALSFQLDAGHIVSALGINVQRDLAAVRRLIERRVPVDAAALADPAQPLAAMLKR